LCKDGFIKQNFYKEKNMKEPKVYFPKDGYTVTISDREFDVGEFIHGTAWKCINKIKKGRKTFDCVAMFDGKQAAELESHGIDPRTGSTEKLPDAFAISWMFS